MKMQQATEKEFGKLYGIILGCSEWLKSRGIDQWDPPYPSYRFKLETNLIIIRLTFGMRAAETEARKNGIKYLRLDVVKANGFLADYYEKNGFERVHEDKSHGAISIFMEKTV